MVEHPGECADHSRSVFASGLYLIEKVLTYAILVDVKASPSINDEVDERFDVVSFELLTRALIGIALEGLQVAGSDRVSLPQFRLLLALDGLGRVPSSRLAAQLGLAPSAVTRMVDRLQDAGLVQRGADQRSRCIVTVEPTAAGQRLVTAVLGHRHELLAAVLNRMPRSDRAAAVRAARLFAGLSGDAIAVGGSGPVPL